MNADVREKAVRAITEICNTRICLELKQKSLIKLFLIIHTSLLWTDFILVASMNKDTISTEMLKVNYLGIVTNCLHKNWAFLCRFCSLHILF